jgi:hypothetical protein
MHLLRRSSRRSVSIEHTAAPLRTKAGNPGISSYLLFLLRLRGCRTLRFQGCGFYHLQQSSAPPPQPFSVFPVHAPKACTNPPLTTKGGAPATDPPPIAPCCRRPPRRRFGLNVAPGTLARQPFPCAFGSRARLWRVHRFALRAQAWKDRTLETEGCGTQALPALRRPHGSVS